MILNTNAYGVATCKVDHLLWKKVSKVGCFIHATFNVCLEPALPSLHHDLPLSLLLWVKIHHLVKNVMPWFMIVFSDYFLIQWHSNLWNQTCCWAQLLTYLTCWFTNLVAWSCNTLLWYNLLCDNNNDFVICINRNGCRTRRT